MPKKLLRTLLVTGVLLVSAGCTLHHSKVVLPEDHEGPIDWEAKFITEDDSGLAILSLFVVSEPDHYAVLLARARRRCDNLHHVQIDFYTDVWLFVSFPIVRLTAICDPPKEDSTGKQAGESAPAAAPAAGSAPEEPPPPPVPDPPPVPEPPPAPEPAPEGGTR